MKSSTKNRIHTDINKQIHVLCVCVCMCTERVKESKAAKMKIINGENKHTLTEYQIMLKFRMNAKRNKQLSRR